MKDSQKYKALDTALNMPIVLMRDIFGDNYLKWEDKTAKDIYIDLLNVIDKVWAQERKLKEKK